MQRTMLSRTSANIFSQCTCHSSFSPLSAPSTSSWSIAASTSRRAASSSSKKSAAPAKKKQNAFSSKGKKGAAGAEGGTDSKTETMRKTLYGSDATARRQSESARASALQEAIPDVDVHETIVRAWQLHKRQQREGHQQALQDRYESMLEAIDELEKVSRPHWKLATQGPKFSTVRGTKGEAGKRASLEGRIEGLFPRQLPVLR